MEVRADFEDDGERLQAITDVPGANRRMAKLRAMATVVVTELGKPLWAKPKTDQHDVERDRLLTLLPGSLTTGVAFGVSGIEQIVKASSAFRGLFAGPILALFLPGMLTRRANVRGWLAGVVAAIPATIWLRYGTDAHFIDDFPLGPFISGCVGYAARVVVDVFGDGSMANRKRTIRGREWPS